MARHAYRRKQKKAIMRETAVKTKLACRVTDAAFPKLFVKKFTESERTHKR